MRILSSNKCIWGFILRIALGVPSRLEQLDGTGFPVAFRQVRSALADHETLVFAPGGGDIPLEGSVSNTGLISQYYNTLALSRDFSSKVKTFNPDSILAFTGMGLFLDRKFIYYTSNVPYKRVLQLIAGEYPQNSYFSELIDYYQFVADREYENYAKAEHIVVLSHKIKEAIVEEHRIAPNKITYLPRSIPLLFEYSDISKKGIDIHKKMQIILMPSQIRVMKGVKYAIETMKILKNELNNAVLVICGRINQYEQAYLNSLMNEAKGKANIVITGYIPKEQFYSYMRTAECAFMPFCFDECPISLTECIGSCLPVVTNEYAGFEKPVINTFGYCAEYKNVRDYADALITMLTDPEFNQSKRRGCKTMTETFTFHQFKENLNRVFEKFGKA